MKLSMRKSNVRLIVLAGFYILYLVIGASVFSAIEGPQERELIKELKQQREDFLKSHQKCEQKCLSDADLEDFIVKIVQATNRGISAVKNVTRSNPNWSFGQSIFFAGTVITTIGYGRVTPLSEAGKGFCILYALIGIPLTLVFFSAIVERLMIPATMFLHFLFRQLGHLYKVFHIQVLHLFIMDLIVLIFFFLIPAWIYTTIEPTWNYLDAFYYCFISLTTVGLGDYIPGDSPEQPLRPLYKVCTTCYLFLGLLMMMLNISVLYEIPELNIGFHFYMKSDADEDERQRLHSSAIAQGPKYTKQIDDDTATGSEYQGVPSFPRPPPRPPGPTSYQETDGALQTQ